MPPLEMLQKLKLKFSKLSSTKFILLGYLFIITLGGFLLSLPVSSRTGAWTPFSQSVFTATSATCVTGLVLFDTFTYWSYFGQLVILILIQIGGVGFMTFAISLITLTKKKIGLSHRYIMRESVAAPQIGGIIRMTQFILVGSLIVEAVGAFLLSFYYIPKVGTLKGLYFSVFHAVSAFCNAGFDLMGQWAPSSSLTLAADNWYLNGIIMALIVIGGLGFFVWSDLLQNRLHFKKLRLHSKIVLSVTLILIVAGAALLFIFEQNGSLYSGRKPGSQVLYSLFQSVTARTAGFNTVPLSELTQSSQLMLIVLMLIGGSTGSTAGGMKTTTFAIVMLSVMTIFRRKKSLECFHRRIVDDTLRTASCVLTLYIALTIVSTVVISAIEGIDVHTVMFETASAVGTVGLTLGITPVLSIWSDLILIFLMIFGRVGSITMILAFAATPGNVVSKFPAEQVRVG